MEAEEPDLVIEEWVERTLPFIRKSENRFAADLHKMLFFKSNELIFHKDRAQFEFRNLLKLSGQKSGALRLRATGKDPIIKFPPLLFEPNNEYVLHININSSVESQLQVYYSDADNTGYPFKEQHSIAIEIEKGDNDVCIALDYPNLGKHLRLDPILGSVEVTISSLDIKRLKTLISSNKGERSCLRGTDSSLEHR